MATSAISSAVGGRVDALVGGGRHALVLLGEAADAGGVAAGRGRDGPLVAAVEGVLGGEAAPLERAAGELAVDGVGGGLEPGRDPAREVGGGVGRPGSSGVRRSVRSAQTTKPVGREAAAAV